MYLPLKNVQDSFLFYFFSAFSFLHVSQTLSRNILNFYKLIKPQNSFYLNEHTLAWSMHFSAISIICSPSCSTEMILKKHKKYFPLGKGHMKMQSRQVNSGTHSVYNQGAEYHVHIYV